MKPTYTVTVHETCVHVASYDATGALRYIRPVEIAVAIRLQRKIGRERIAWLATDVVEALRGNSP